MGHKQQARERRLMKGFNIGMVEGLEGGEGQASKAEDKIKKMAMAMGFLGVSYQKRFCFRIGFRLLKNFNSFNID